jgi:YidC/Oxa1 family membrane protein insertase
MMLQQQKIMMYVFPIIFAVSGVNFPVGVLIYWGTTNLWTMGQQFYVIKRNPTPGSPAFEELEKKRAAKGISTSSDSTQNDSTGGTTTIDPTQQPGQPGQPGQRQQPKKKKKRRP